MCVCVSVYYLYRVTSDFTAVSLIRLVLFATVCGSVVDRPIPVILEGKETLKRTPTRFRRQGNTLRYIMTNISSQSKRSQSGAATARISYPVQSPCSSHKHVDIILLRYHRPRPATETIIWVWDRFGLDNVVPSV